MLNPSAVGTKWKEDKEAMINIHRTLKIADLTLTQTIQDAADAEKRFKLTEDY